MSDTNTLSLESAELPLSDYRALREGREVTKLATASAAPAADAVAAPAAAADAPQGGETPNNETPTQDNGKDNKNDKDGLKLRFSELTSEIKTLKAQLAAKTGASAEAAKPAEVAPAAAAPSSSEDPEPDPAKYDDYVKWQKEWMRWDRRQEQRAEAARTAETASKQAAQTQANAWQERVKAASASEEMKDFAAVAQNPDLAVSPVMGSAIVDSEIGPEILYHLGKNPDEATRISKLPEVAQVREIGKLQAKLEAAKAAKTEESQEDPPVAVSKAPRPVRPVAAASTNHAKNIESMTQAEFRALRESGKLS